jgi:hypothetical protein
MSNWVNHLKHLEEQHHTLDKKIQGLESTGVYEDETLHSMKKQKLHLKDEITKLKAQHESRTA